MQPPPAATLLVPCGSCHTHPWLTALRCVVIQGAGADAEAEAEPIKCPVGGGGFQELYAVAVLLSHQDKLAEAEVCLSDAITTTVPAYRMLSDIATVNSAQIPVTISVHGLFFAPWHTVICYRRTTARLTHAPVWHTCWIIGQFGRAAAIAEVIETLTNNGPCQRHPLTRCPKNEC